jgi:hypothetical protein
MTRGIAALIPESGWDGELADLMVPFSTLRRCLQIVKVVTTAAYRVDKVAKLFSTGGSRAMWARLRRAEISAISRDMACVVMSIAAVRLAPDAKIPIPLPAIANAMNILIQCTSVQERRASTVTLVMIGSAAAALVPEEDVANCGVLAGKWVQPERRGDFASWICSKVIVIVDQAGSDGNKGLGVKKDLVERHRVWVLEILRGNGPLVAPMFATERDEKRIEGPNGMKITSSLMQTMKKKVPKARVKRRARSYMWKAPRKLK